MKGVLGWIKSHLIIVISTVVILAALPTGWVFSSKWNKDIKDKQEKRASTAYNQIKNAKVNYVIPSLVPDEPSWSESRAPNTYFTNFVKAEREKRISSASGILGEVESFNRRGHQLLEPGLLPEPANPQMETGLKYSLLAKLAGNKRLGIESLYDQLFEEIGAGGPPDMVKLATSIQDLSERETERMLAESGESQLTDEQTEELRKLLSERRVGEAQRRAKEISVYADSSVFDSQGFGNEPGKTAQIPPLPEAEREASVAPTLAEAYSWNFDYWVVSDILDAIDAANTDAGGLRANVENAVVKRIERFSVQQLPIDPPEKKELNRYEVEEEPEDTSVAVKPEASTTGRVSNDQFDVCNVKLSLVVDAAKLPQLFDAFAQTNLMTVLDVDILEIDPWDDLRQGYFYGNGRIARVNLEIETIWLRSWTSAFMPEDVKAARNIPTEEEFSDDG